MNIAATIGQQVGAYGVIVVLSLLFALIGTTLLAELMGEEVGRIIFLPMMIFLTAILIIFFGHRVEFDVKEKLERGTDAALMGPGSSRPLNRNYKNRALWPCS